MSCNTSCRICNTCAGRNYSFCYYNCRRCNRCRFKNPYKIYQSDCYSLCPSSVCNRYNDMLSDYNNCKKCKKNGECWSRYQQRCTKCLYNRSCEEEFGCRRRYYGFLKGNRKPTNPVYSNCKLCSN